MSRHTKCIFISVLASIAINLLIFVPPTLRGPGMPPSAMDRFFDRMLSPVGWLTKMFFPGHTSLGQVIFGLLSSLLFFAIICLVCIKLFVLICEGRYRKGHE
jgi:hypothetical protein